MDKKISGVGNHPIVPFRADVAGFLEAKPKRTSTHDDIITPILHPHAFRVTRNAIPKADYISGLIKLQEELFEKNLDVELKRILRIGEPTRTEVSDLLSKFDGNEEFLLKILKEKFIASLDEEEKTATLKILCAIEGDAPISEFVACALDSEDGNDYADFNSDYCMKLLRSLEEKDLRRVLSTVDYGSIENPPHFLSKLLIVVSPEMLFDILIKDIDEPGVYFEEDGNDKAEKIAKKQKSALAAATIIFNRFNPVQIDKLEKLYKNAINVDISWMTIELISKVSKDDAIRILRERIFDREESDNDVSRIKRFYAIGHMGKLFQAGGIDTLKDFMQTEDDSFLIGHAVHSLVNQYGKDGKKALADHIVGEIRNNKPNLPFAMLTQMLQFGSQYVELVEDVFAENYDLDSGIKDAFKNLQGYEISGIGRNNEGVMVFQLNKQERKDLVVDLIEDLMDLDLLPKWFVEGEGLTEQTRCQVKENITYVYDYANEINPRRMDEIILRRLILIDSSDEDLGFRKRFGMSKINKREED